MTRFGDPAVFMVLLCSAGAGSALLVAIWGHMVLYYGLVNVVMSSLGNCMSVCITLLVAYSICRGSCEQRAEPRCMSSHEHPGSVSSGSMCTLADYPPWSKSL